MSKYLIGQKVIINTNEIGTVVKPENDNFDESEYVWVFSPVRGYSSAYAKHNVKIMCNLDEPCSVK